MSLNANPQWRITARQIFYQSRTTNHELQTVLRSILMVNRDCKFTAALPLIDRGGIVRENLFTKLRP